MEVRRVEIENYRGIKSLDFRIPKDQRFVCLVGPGDAGKSTVLEAIHLAVSDRWNITVSDTDFYNCDPSSSIRIRVTVADLDEQLLRENALGLCLSGISEDGTMHRDPADGTDPCAIVQLEIDESLEPRWTVERYGEPDSGQVLSASVRRAFAALRVDERIDVHLRWTRTSALGRLSGQAGGTTSAMAEAARAARMAIENLESSELSQVSQSVQARFHAVGGGDFEAIRPGLDTSLSSAGGNLALYEGSVPLTNYGLGTRRLAGVAVQQLAAGSRSIVLIDEVEYGLEPHRLVSFLRHLKADPVIKQVFVTTHSPIAVEQMATTDLAIIRSGADQTTAAFLDTKSSTTTRLQRQRPSSFLARRLVVVEGKTEEGFLLQLIEHWDSERLESGASTAAGRGVVIQDGQGGSDAPPRAAEFQKRGYETALLLDNDDRSIDKAVRRAEEAGSTVFRWTEGFNTETEVVSELTTRNLTSLLQLGISVRRNEATVRNDLLASGMPEVVTGLDVDHWVEYNNVSLEDARQFIGAAMVEAEWFKGVDQGRELGEWVMTNRNSFSNTDLAATLHGLKTFIYGDLRLEPDVAGDSVG